MRKLVSVSICTLSLLILGILATPARADEPRPRDFPLKARRILFLGDSITHSGHYIYWIETQLRLRGVSPLPEMINIGLSSETCSGLSEPGHPFPRPNVQNRIEKALDLVQPDVVVACYGMNDGIYHPFDESRFLAYQRGIQRIIDLSHARGAKVILLTPPPFDPLVPREKGKLLPAGQPEYAYYAMYENYDDVLKRYGEWIMQQGNNADMVINVHRPVSEYVARQRLKDPQFTLIPDGIHPNPAGHRILAEAILPAWGLPASLEPDPELLKLVTRRGTLLHDAWLSHIGHDRPGVAAGLPLEEARQQAQQLEQQINTRLEALRKP
ncbi:MAG: SGNH/GDSL hydrolase family protein [Planctomycetaceae bacterium]|nr:SGNH/GDSL hydrolase family protein [Planctomycetaceae bacterium]